MLVERFGTQVTLRHPNDFLLPHQYGKPTLVCILLVFYLPCFLEVTVTEGRLNHTNTPHTHTQSTLKLNFCTALHSGYCILILASNTKLCDFENEWSWSSLKITVTWVGRTIVNFVKYFFPFFLWSGRYWFGKCLWYVNYKHEL